jgi:hypothetical protein
VQRLPRDAWQRTLRRDSHGKELVRYVAELELGRSYGPTHPVRLIAATPDPTRLTPESTWYLATSLPLAQVSAEQIYELYRLRDWIEQSCKPVKHELGWADYQMRPERAIERHWHLVLLAYTFSLLVGTVPTTPPRPPIRLPRPTTSRRAGGKSAPDAAPRVVWAATLRRVRSWLCPWAQPRRYGQRWSSGAPPARAGRAPRPRRRFPAPWGPRRPDPTNHR